MLGYAKTIVVFVLIQEVFQLEIKGIKKTNLQSLRDVKKEYIKNDPINEQFLKSSGYDISGQEAFTALCTRGNEVFGCIDEYCHDFEKLFSTNSIIKGVSYGNSINDIFVLTANELKTFEMVSSTSTVYNLNIVEDVVSMKYDHLNRIMNIGTKKKIYHIKVANNIEVYEFSVPKQFLIIEFLNDPLNGYIYILINEKYSSFYIKIPSVLMQNESMSTVNIARTEFKIPFSLLQSPDYRVWEMLTEDKIILYDVRNMTLVPFKIFAKFNFNASFKFERQAHGYLAWSPNKLYTLELRENDSVYFVTDIPLNFTLYTNSLSVTLGDPVPEQGMEITSSFFGNNFVILQWRQNFPPQTSPTRWDRWNYTVDIISNQSILHTSIVNKKFFFGDGNLKEGSEYIIRIQIGKFSQSIKGNTLYKKPKSVLKYFVCTNNSIEEFEMALENLSIIKKRTLLTGYYGVKSILVFRECSFILLRNGSIVKTPDYSNIEKTINWVPYNGVLARKIEVDSKYGNIYYIGKEDNMIYRIRPTENNSFTTDQITSLPVEDFVLYLTENSLVYSNQSGIFLISLNGDIPARIFPNKMSYSYASDVKLIRMGQKFNVISPRMADTKWKTLSFGVANFDKGLLTIFSFCGNSSMNLWNNTLDILDVFEPNMNSYEVKILPTIKPDSIKIDRTKADRLLLYWNKIDIKGNITYNIIIRNKLETIKWVTKNELVDVTKQYSCSDNITVKIKPCIERTCGELIIKTLSVPCTRGPPQICSLFCINKKTSIQNMDRIEIYANISTETTTDIIDNLYKCIMEITFVKDNISKLIVSGEIKCLDRRVLVAIMVKKVDKFLWDKICLRIVFANERVERCQDLDFWKSTSVEIHLVKNQAFIRTFTNEKFQIIFQDKTMYTLNILNSDGRNRSILKSTCAIENFEIDWLKNTIFWSESCRDFHSIYGVNIGTNKKNLFEDKIVWFRSADVVSSWDIDSIQRNMNIKVNGHQYQYNLDAGPGWSNKILAECYSFLTHKNKTECQGDRGSWRSRRIQMYYIRENNLIVLKNDLDQLCKIVHLNKKYYITSNIKGCTQVERWRDLSCQKPMLKFITDDEKYWAVDADGQAYFRPPDKTNECSLHLLDLKIHVEVTCRRNKGIIFIKSNNSFPNYKVNISYGWDGLNSSIKTELLNQNIIDGNIHLVNIEKLYPATKYTFYLDIYSLQSESPLLSSKCSCQTTDDIPDPPTNIRITTLNETYFKMTWDDGRTNGGNISSYNIRVRRISYVTSVREFFLHKDVNESIIVSIETKTELGESREITRNIISIQPVQSTGQDLYSSKLTSPTLVILSVLVTFIGLIIVLIVCHKKQRRHLSSQQHFRTSKDETIEMGANFHSVHYEINCLYSSDPLPLTEFDKIPHIPQSSLSCGHLIGNGAFGMVFKGTMKVDCGTEKHKLESVALKMRHGKALSEEDFKREAVLLFKYSCPYIIGIYGVSFDSPERQYIILEYMEKGNLRQYLQYHRPDSMTTKRAQLNSGRNHFSKSHTLIFKDFFEMASDVLEAMKFLESKKFVHRDLAARNCLVSHKHKKRRIIKLGDFGLARDIYSDEYYRKVSEKKLPIRWMSPETIKDGIFSGKSDIWSFGVLLWEIVSMGMDPYMGITNSDVVKDVIAGKHLDKPENCSYEFYEVMLQCWKYYPEQRPNFTEIDLLFHRLDEMRDCDEMTSSNRLIIRSCVSTDSSNIDCDDGNNSEHPTEKTFLTLSDKYFEISSQPLKIESIKMQPNYENLAYDVPSTRSRMVSTTTEQTNLEEDTMNGDVNI